LVLGSKLDDKISVPNDSKHCLTSAVTYFRTEYKQNKTKQTALQAVQSFHHTCEKGCMFLSKATRCVQYTINSTI